MRPELGEEKWRDCKRNDGGGGGGGGGATTFVLKSSVKGDGKAKRKAPRVDEPVPSCIDASNESQPLAPPVQPATLNCDASAHRHAGATHNQL